MGVRRLEKPGFGRLLSAYSLDRSLLAKTLCGMQPNACDLDILRKLLQAYGKAISGNNMHILQWLHIHCTGSCLKHALQQAKGHKKDVGRRVQRGEQVARVHHAQLDTSSFRTKNVESERMYDLKQVAVPTSSRTMVAIDFRRCILNVLPPIRNISGT